MKKIIAMGIIAGLVLAIDLLWFSSLPWLHLAVNLSLLMVIALTIGESLLIGIVFALVAGLGYSLHSAISGPTYIVAFIAAAGFSWIFSHTIVTTRSAISFVSTIIASSAVYTILIILVELLASLLNRQRLHLDLAVVGVAGLIQIVVHPIVLSFFWRLFGRHQYHRLSTSPGRSF